MLMLIHILSLGWDKADQVILIIRNIRHTIDSYHDILADIGK